mmetsp:Transcript_23236/g.67069  ORF Transcript_23236/g.67069 Transcript_23236/m.67069 type:complete len:801 (-) Transcript_23236:2043-4445(-)|eukprot:CAMPEP_0181054148 /NCGR_PEP_ID=MMETSP1070-20121207/18523_1 /TAXON_ID=265543 /ORGANISM="Minutocellus polymorphus, Strain NH13" /LENGTH=800 /DNA_ID=CAMNT_0023133397 /DNA_START=136 /DNA_END=2538 /DNA_ORIENTATION=+
MTAFHTIAVAVMAFALGPAPFVANEGLVHAFSIASGTIRLKMVRHHPPSITHNSRRMKKDDIDKIEITTIEQAQELRRRAEALRAEAEAAERKLRDETSARKRQRDAEMDVFIDELVSAAAVNQTELILLSTDGGGEILPDGSDDIFNMKRVDAIVAMLKSYSEPLSSTKLLRIVERIHERERIATDAGNSVGSTASGELKKNFSQLDAQKVALGAGLGGLAQALIDAIEVVEEGNVSDTGSVTADVQAAPPGSLPSKAGVPPAQRIDSAPVSRNRFSLVGSSAAAPRLRARMKELQRADEETSKRDFALFSKRLELLRRGSNATLTSLQRQNRTGTSNSTLFAAMKDFVEVPGWLPNSIVPFLLLDRKPINKNDTQRLREEVLSGSPFFCTGWESCGYATIFRGNFVEKRRLNMKSIETARKRAAVSQEANNSLAISSLENDRISSSAFAAIQSRFAKSGLGARLQLFLLQDPEESRNEQGELPPAILAVPSSIQPIRGSDYRLTTKVLMTLATIYTTINFAISCYTLSTGSFFESMTTGKSLRPLRQCLSQVGGGIASLLVIYEMARYTVAKRRGMSLSLPTPMPSLHFGTLGCRTQLKSFPRTRKELLDVALSGPVATMLLSVFMLIGGLHLTTTATSAALAKMPAIPTGIVCKTSFLVSLITMKMCPKLLMLPLSQPVPIHPLVLIGTSGLTFSAISLLPIGRLDGGRAMMAAFGRRNAALASFLSLLILLLSAANGSTTISMFCAFLILLYQRKAESLVTDEVTGVGPVRVWLYTILLSVAGLTLAPFPGGFVAL